eukprot:TRINITY_DN3834_c0_g1_i1.p1 TRINITY_DN3834_c0_g1~~TRINITY_DN3834_c0_g1_i1.p1  ORF type:complete len:731 (-),score=216.35 TRINITY_DN3834_c0_g1_i1:44-2236(-)
MSGWEESNVTYISNNINNEGVNERVIETHNQNSRMRDYDQEYITKIKRFVQTFEVNKEFYSEKLKQNVLMGLFKLEIDIDKLNNFDRDLVYEIKSNPMAVKPSLEQGLTELALEILKNERDVPKDLKMQVILVSRDHRVTPMKQLNSDHVNKLVRVPGIIIKTSSVFAKPTHITIQCRDCKYKETIECFQSGPEGAKLPDYCKGGTDPNKKCTRNPFYILDEFTKFVDQQNLTIQESPECVQTGDIPKQITMWCERELTNSVVTGARVVITGVYCATGSKRKKGEEDTGIRTTFIEILGIEVEKSSMGGPTLLFSQKEEHECISISKSGNIYEKIWKSIAPEIFGHDDIKKSIACLLFGGTTYFMPDNTKMRGDINVLLMGDPGIGKSQFLKFVSKLAPIGVYTSGKSSSAAGLTACVSRDNKSKEYYLEGGAMVLADGGVVCIDEFDKMREEDQVSIHEAMEQQTISIAKAGITTVLNSRTSVLAAANPVYGSYDDTRGSGDNIDFRKTILSRFDCIFLMKDKREFNKDKSFAQHTIQIHQNRSISSSNKAPIEMEVLKKYISYARSKCFPKLTEETASILEDHYVQIRKSVKNNNSDSNAIPITVRQLEAIARISESLAKMELSDYVTKDHLEEAIRIFKVSTLDAASSGVVSTDNINPHVMESMEKIETTFRNLVPIGYSKSEKILVNEIAKVTKCEPQIVRNTLIILSQREEIEYRNNRKTIKRKR